MVFGIKTKTPIIVNRKRNPVENKTVERRLGILIKFAYIYCKKHHYQNQKGKPLCQDCSDLIDYARERIKQCPYEPKPKCKTCKTHCYQQNYRVQVKAIMRYSGMYYIKRGRIDWLIKYFLSE